MQDNVAVYLTEAELIELCRVKKIVTVKWIGRKGDRKLVVYGVR